MYTAVRIRKYIFSLEPETIFSTREVLSYGKRAAVDKCLSRSVKRGQIIRLARGIFKRFSGSTLPSAFVVAQNKARAFGKQIAIEVLNQIEDPLTYVSSGHSSKFKIGKITIRLRGICSRKMHLTQSTTGLALKALWSLGFQLCDQNAIMMLTNDFTRQNRYEMRQLACFIPAWLSDKLFFE